jgi:hypothetical protein
MALWNANIGRNLALGDFTVVNLERVELETEDADDKFYLIMVRSLITMQNDIAKLSPNPSRLLFTCSGPDDEVSYVWSVQ